MSDDLYLRDRVDARVALRRLHRHVPQGPVEPVQPLRGARSLEAAVLALRLAESAGAVPECLRVRGHIIGHARNNM